MMEGHVMDEGDFDAAFAEESGTGGESEKGSTAEEGLERKGDLETGVTGEGEGEGAHLESEDGDTTTGGDASQAGVSTEDESRAAIEAESEDEVSKLRKQLKAQDGRAAAYDAKIKALEDRLAEMESRPGDQVGQRGQEQPAPVEIPEKLKREAQEFRDVYPGLYPLLEEAGADGDRARKLLEDYGVDQAAVWAKSVSLERKINSLEAGMQTTQQAVSGADHRERLATAHPETRGYWSTDPALRKEYDTFCNEVRAWVETQPAYVRPAINQILEKGGADKVIAVLDHFKASRKTKPEQPLDADKRRRAAAAGAVSNSHPVTPPRGEPDPDDYQGALMEAFELS